MLDHYLKKILTSSVYDVAKETPLDRANSLSERMGNVVRLKREDLQPVFSFKLRGAYNKMAQLSVQARERGVIAASAGNHAQGVALAAQRLKMRAVIVMPRTTPEIKVRAVRNFGAEVLLVGDAFDEAAAEASAMALGEGLTYIPPYDDEAVIAGQGTVGLEILRQSQGLDAVFVPVGGGGLIAGIAACVKALRPETLVIGVEPEDSACLYHAMQAGERVVLDQVGLFADGVAVAQIGDEPFRIASQYVDDSVRVSSDEICAAIKDIFEETRVIAEPAGALALAGLKRYVTEKAWRGRDMTAIVSGANTNFHRLRHISERTELGEGREAIFAVTIPERRGSFGELCEALQLRNITEFNYRYADAVDAQVFVGVQLDGGHEERSEVIRRLEAKRYGVVDLSENELAKTHLRYMVGGKGPAGLNEVLYHFSFPERPGALLHFLDGICGRWNISLFHYRNHGSAHGRVLAGFQVEDRERTAFEDALKDLGFPFRDETTNPAFETFLAAPSNENAFPGLK